MGPHHKHKYAVRHTNRYIAKYIHVVQICAVPSEPSSCTGTYHEILGLHIPVQDVPAMDSLDAKSHLLQDVLRLCQAEDQTCCAPENPCWPACRVAVVIFNNNNNDSNHNGITTIINNNNDDDNNDNNDNINYNNNN